MAYCDLNHDIASLLIPLASQLYITVMLSHLPFVVFGIKLFSTNQ